MTIYVEMQINYLQKTMFICCHENTDSYVDTSNSVSVLMAQWILIHSLIIHFLIKQNVGHSPLSNADSCYVIIQMTVLGQSFCLNFTKYYQKSKQRHNENLKLPFRFTNECQERGEFAWAFSLYDQKFNLLIITPAWHSV